MSVTPIASARSARTASDAVAATPLDVQTLSVDELHVIFYASDYQLTGDDVLAGGNLPRMYAALTRVVAQLGMDLIRDAAAVLDHADITDSRGLLGQLMPDAVRRVHARLDARRFRALLGSPLPAAHLLAALQRWHTALGQQYPAVSA
jgi:hypothetical protein